MIGTPAVGEVNGEPAIFAAAAIQTPVGEPLDTPQRGVDRSLAEDPGRLLSLHAISARDGRVLWRSPVTRPSYGAPTYADGVVLVGATAGFSLEAFDADTGLALGSWPLDGPPSSAPAIVGDSVYLGTGTRFGDVAPAQTPDPTAQASGVWAFQLP
jgi:outer membrane protein assembly factor BamB